MIIVGINNVLIIDLDVHQGDGTAAIFKENKNVFTFSIHCESNFPLKKMRSDIDVSLNKEMKDNQYLKILREHLENLNNVKSDIIFFQAGVDSLKQDKLGHLSLTKEGLKKRNEIILDFAKKRSCPMVVFMGGGYSDPIDFSVESFVDLFLQCSDYQNEFLNIPLIYSIALIPEKTAPSMLPLVVWSPARIIPLLLKCWLLK